MERTAEGTEGEADGAGGDALEAIKLVAGEVEKGIGGNERLSEVGEEEGHRASSQVD
jgi:hypothetical protein